MVKTCVIVLGISVIAIWTGKAADLPVEVRQQLEKQRASMQTLYVQFVQNTVRNGREATYTNYACFEGDRFRLNSPSDVSFDGEMLWHVTARPKEPFIIRKTQIRNTSDRTPSFNENYWLLPYLEAAGIYFPPYPRDIRTFDSLKPLVLHFVENGQLMEIMPEGEHLRLRFSVDDWLLINLREIDPVAYDKSLAGQPKMTPAARSNELAHLARMQAMVPKRTVSMLLDSKNGYAPLEREDRTAQGQLIAQYRVEEWKYFSNATIWLPAECVVSNFTNPYTFDEFRETALQTTRITLKEADFAPRKKEFVMMNDPRYRTAGTEIHDETISNVVDGVRRGAILIMAADGTLLDNAVPLVKMSGNRTVLIVILLLILAAPPFMYYFWQRRSSRH